MIEIVSEDTYSVISTEFGLIEEELIPKYEKIVSKEVEVLSKKIETSIQKTFPSLTDEQDYHISYDWNVCWNHSMGITSLTLYSKKFVAMMQEVLASMPHEWSIEVACMSEKLRHDGQLLFYKGMVFADGSSKLKYKKYFM